VLPFPHLKARCHKYVYMGSECSSPHLLNAPPQPL
jgi:hypothetical protein